MKNNILIVIIFLIAMISYSQTKNAPNKFDFKENTLPFYEVFKIDSLNNFYMIYGRKDNSIYKIISKKENIKNCNIIRVNHKYQFDLKSHSSQAPIINGVKLYAPNVDCYAFSEKTTICLERNIGVYELYYADNAKGLCFIK